VYLYNGVKKMAVERLSETKAKVNNTPQTGARLRKPDGTVITQLPEDAVFNPNAEGETRKVDETTGFFGKTVAQLNE
jgi:hypothetical protein